MDGVVIVVVTNDSPVDVVSQQGKIYDNGQPFKSHDEQDHKESVESVLWQHQLGKRNYSYRYL